MIKFEILKIDKIDLEAKSSDEIQRFVDSRLKDLNNGDLVLMSSFDQQNSKHFEEAKFHIVCDLESEKYLCELAKTPTGGFNSIPLCVSKSLTKHPKFNLIKSYSQLYNESLKNYKNTYQAIELDFNLHSTYLPTDLRINSMINKNARLFYFFSRPSDSNNNNSNCEKLDENFYVWFSNSSSTQAKNFHLLTSNIDNLELEDDFNESEEALNETIDLNMSQSNDLIDESNIPMQERDLEMEDFAKQFKSVYENQFRDYLKNLNKNEPLSATSLPTKKYNKDTYEVDSMNSTTLVFYFDGLELDENGNINGVLATAFDKTEECHFTPYLCKEYGPYFKTNLLCCLYNVGRGKDSEAANFFLDLPIDLYNLID